jgi:DNA primase
MRFTPQFLDELRARLPVSEVVGKRVKLKRAGREWKGLSPFQQEKTPSFTVNDQKGFYHDFSSGKHGDIISFLMETERVGFAEAVERLASMAGVPLPAATPDAARHEQRRKTLHDVMELAAKFFADTLASRNGAKARGYLGDRGISPTVQLQFRIGYAPGDRFALKEHLGAQNIPVEDMVEAGLLYSGDDIPVPYDRFRDRVMFPITDVRGRVIAFGGRALEKDVSAKYLNSPETPLFHKGDNLYNLAPARLAAHNGSSLVVVEGYIDVIAMVGAGFPASVAPLGTALTESQLALLWKMADEPILCFDGDKAGQKAAWRAADMALPHLKPGKSLRFALLPEGQDPDDLARSGGRGAIEEVISAARGLADVICRAKSKAARLQRLSGVRRWRRGFASCPTASAMKRCGAITVRIFPSGCNGRLRPRSRAASMQGATTIAALETISVANQAGVLPRAACSRRAPRAGSSRAAGARKGQPAARPSTAGLTRRQARSLR